MRPVYLCLAVILLLLVSPLQAQEAPLNIVASHSIAADVIARVAGDDAEVITLIPRGSDPHSFRPAPSDLRALANADLVFINGANYEEGLLPVIDAAVEEAALFVLSQCVPMLAGGHAHDEHGHDEHDDHHDDEGDDHADEDHMDDDHADDEHHDDEHDDHAEDDHHDDEGDEHADEEDHADEDHDEHADEDHHEGEGDDHDEADHHDDEDDDHADEAGHHDDEDDDHAHDDHAVEMHFDEGTAARCEQQEAELGDRFVALQDENAVHGPLYAVDCAAIDGCDPHVWLQPRGIAHWALTARDILSAHDGAHAEGYHARADGFLDEIEALEQDELLPLIATLAPEQRLLVTHHSALGYLAGTYGFTELGGVVPGFSTMAEPGVAELAELIDLIRERNLQAIFGETVTSDALVQQIAAETGASVVPLTIESLGEEGSPTGTWPGFMRNMVETIVNALSGETGG